MQGGAHGVTVVKLEEDPCALLLEELSRLAQ